MRHSSMVLAYLNQRIVGMGTRRCACHLFIRGRPNLTAAALRINKIPLIYRERAEIDGDMRPCWGRFIDIDARAAADAA